MSLRTELNEMLVCAKEVEARADALNEYLDGYFVAPTRRLQQQSKELVALLEMSLPEVLEDRAQGVGSLIQSVPGSIIGRYEGKEILSIPYGIQGVLQAMRKLLDQLAIAGVTIGGDVHRGESVQGDLQVSTLKVEGGAA